jgi:hypothetical protein
MRRSSEFRVLTAVLNARRADLYTKRACCAQTILTTFSATGGQPPRQPTIYLIVRSLLFAAATARKLCQPNLHLHRPSLRKSCHCLRVLSQQVHCSTLQMFDACLWRMCNLRAKCEWPEWSSTRSPLRYAFRGCEAYRSHILIGPPLQRPCSL